MKILFCTNQVNTHGGIERILSQKINFLIQVLGHEVYLVTFEQKNKKPVYNLDNNCILKDLNINYVSNLSYYHPLNLYKIVKHYFKLKSEISTIKPDVVVSISFTPDQYFIPYIDKKIKKFKELHSSGSVITHGILNGNFITNYYKNCLNNIFKKYNKLILLTEDEKQYFDNKNVVIIPNFSDFLIENDIKREKTIIAVGRITEVKNFNALIEIWLIENQKHKNWKVKIFGDGDANFVQNLKNKVKDLGLENSFLIFPSTNNIQLEMQKASIFAMTSLTECFPLVLLEAQICGLPIVSFNCPNGPRNIIKHNKDGFLIENENKILFADKLDFLIKNESLRVVFSKNAQKNVNQFNKNSIILRWNTILNEEV